MRMPYGPDQQYHYCGTEFLNYRSIGSGERTVVFLHGFGASSHCWDDIIPLIDTAGTRLILFDLIGAGFSSKPKEGDYTMRANAAVIASFIRENGLRDCVIAGHSFGGGVALHAALQLLDDAKHRPAALMLLDAAAYPTAMPFFVAALRIPLLSDVLLALAPPRFQARYTLRRLYFDKAKVTPKKVGRYAFFMALKENAAALKETARQISPQDWQDIGRYREIPFPVLVLWGRQDTILPVEIAQRLAADIPGSRLVVVEDSGHNVQEEQPDKVARSINGFIAAIHR